uniref:hypothetical protein n=1 Tax=Bifidobacterium pseudocatenulatum TaxID=28026 RepID=UPI00232F5ACF
RPIIGGSGTADLLFQRVDHGLKLVSLGLTVRGIEHAGLHHDHHGFSLINRQSGVKETLPQLVLKNVSRVVNLLLSLLGRADTIDGQQTLESFRTEDASEVSGHRVLRFSAYNQPRAARIVVLLSLDQATPFERVWGSLKRVLAEKRGPKFI